MHARTGASACLQCGYDLELLPDGICPECGTAFTHAMLLTARLEREGRRAAIARSLAVRVLTCLLAAIGFLIVAILCGFIALGSPTMAAIAVAGGALMGAIIDEFLSVGRAKPTRLRAMVELVVAFVGVMVACGVGGIAGSPLAACIMATAVCQLVRAHDRRRGRWIIAMPGICLVLLAMCIVVPAQVRVMQGFRYSEWDAREPSIRFRSTAMTAVEARKRGFIVGGAGLAALAPAALLRRRHANALRVKPVGEV
jgi:hypothetical protein